MGFVIAVMILVFLIPGLAFLMMDGVEWLIDKPTKEDKWKTKAKAFEKERDNYKAVASARTLELVEVRSENEAMRTLLGYPTIQEIQKTERELALEAAKAAIREEFPEIEFKDEQ